METFSGTQMGDVTITRPTRFTGTVMGRLIVEAETIFSGTAMGNVIARAPLSITGVVMGDVTADGAAVTAASSATIMGNRHEVNGGTISGGASAGEAGASSVFGDMFSGFGDIFSADLNTPPGPGETRTRTQTTRTTRNGRTVQTSTGSVHVNGHSFELGSDDQLSVNGRMVEIKPRMFKRGRGSSVSNVNGRVDITLGGYDIKIRGAKITVNGQEV